MATTYDTPLVAYVHHLEPLPFSRPKYHPILRSVLIWASQSMSLRILRRRTDLVLTNIVDEGRIRRLGYQMNTIPMTQGVDPYDVNNRGESHSEYDALYLGRITESKGVFDLVEIWQKVLKTYPDLTLAIAGGGPGMEREEAELRRVVVSQSLTNSIKLLGQVTDKEKYELMGGSRLFLFPSYEEGWGIVIGEAMARGNAVVVYNLPVYAVFRDGINRVNVGDKDDFAASICRLVEDEDLRKKLVSRAKKIAEDFDWNRIASNEIKLFNELINKRGRVNEASQGMS